MPFDELEKYKQELMKEFSFETCCEELARANFTHVNDTDQNKDFSDKHTSAILYHLEELKMNNQELKTKLLRTIAYLSSLIEFCEKCCYPKRVCQCKVISREKTFELKKESKNG